jgi:high-affinity iron transporter
MNWTPALPTFLITLREGVEAALVVGIVLAYLQKAGRSALNAWVYSGIGAGLVASGLVGLLFIGAITSLDQSASIYATAIKPLLEAVFGVIAIGLLSWMLVWMTQQAKSLKSSLEAQLGAALDQSAGWGVFGIVFFAVLREGFETVVFMAAQFQKGPVPLLGAVGGLLGAVLIGTLLFRWSVRINLKQFFQVMGSFLLLIVGGLVVGALAHLDQGLARLAQIDPQFAAACIAPTVESGGLGTCFLGPLVWDLGMGLPDRQFPGILLKTLLGYRDHLYLVEALAYVAFLLPVGLLYRRSLAGPAAPKSDPKSAPKSVPY